MEQVAGLAEEQQHAAGGGVRKKQAEVLARSLRALRNGLGRLWRRRSATITDYDPTFRVSYLGNVLTGWAKGTSHIFFLIMSNKNLYSFFITLFFLCFHDKN
jgi:hypothetical protein